MDLVRNGNLASAADMYVMTCDNLYVAGSYPYHGCYAGLSGFPCSPGGETTTMCGRGLIDAAAFYYDDGQCRWLSRTGRAQVDRARADLQHSPGHGRRTMPQAHPLQRRVRVPYDRRLYDILVGPEPPRDTLADLRPPPVPYEKALDRVAFRDGVDPDDAYLFLITSQGLSTNDFAAQNNSVARYTDLSESGSSPTPPAPRPGREAWSRFPTAKATAPRRACRRRWRTWDP